MFGEVSMQDANNCASCHKLNASVSTPPGAPAIFFIRGKVYCGQCGKDEQERVLQEIQEKPYAAISGLF